MRLHVPPMSINGSGKMNLLDDAAAVRYALTNAMHAISMISPHPRDYQGMPAEYSAACNEMDKFRMAMAAVTDAVADYESRLAEEIDNQPEGR